MRRDHEWRNNIRNEMQAVMADDPDYTAHRVVRRVVNGQPVESLTASNADRIAYTKLNDGEHHRALVASIYRANMQAMKDAEDDCEDCDCGCEEPGGESFVASDRDSASFDHMLNRAKAGMALAHLASVSE